MPNNYMHNDCLICGAKMNYFFQKSYLAYPGAPFEDTLKIDYKKCEHCGFVISETHKNMLPDYWIQLNTSWHHFFESDFESRTVNQPPYADQALALAILNDNGIVDLGNAIDYAAGYGTLCKIIKKYFGFGINVFDKYVQGIESNSAYLEESDLKKFRLVINSAMFEHILSRESLDEVNNLVSDDGVLMLHTLICERVPKDPSWFYMNPIVHTAFHTNKSMSILMKQWGYTASVYSPQAKSWFLFKEENNSVNNLEGRILAINREIQSDYFYYKPGFVDYWKGF